jgi:hypothetical protein
MADSGVKKHGKKRARDDFKAAGVTSTSPAWSEIDELYEGSTFRSSLLGWNLKCEITGKRFVPYWWEGGHFEVDERYHGKLPFFQKECCTVSKMPNRIRNGNNQATIKSWFCPTLRFAVKDGNSNREPSGYSKFNVIHQSAGHRFGSKQNDVAALDYSPTHTGTMATYMYVRVCWRT